MGGFFSNGKGVLFFPLWNVCVVFFLLFSLIGACCSSSALLSILRQVCMGAKNEGRLFGFCERGGRGFWSEWSVVEGDGMGFGLWSLGFTCLKISLMVDG